MLTKRPHASWILGGALGVILVASADTDATAGDKKNNGGHKAKYSPALHKAWPPVYTRMSSNQRREVRTLFKGIETVYGDGLLILSHAYTNVPAGGVLGAQFLHHVKQEPQGQVKIRTIALHSDGSYGVNTTHRVKPGGHVKQKIKVYKSESTFNLGEAMDASLPGGAREPVQDPMALVEFVDALRWTAESERIEASAEYQYGRAFPGVPRNQPE